MRLILPTVAIGLLAGLCACDRPSGLYADRAVPVAAPTAAADAPSHFVGRWAHSAMLCKNPWVMDARSLKAGRVACEFDKVEASSAGWTAATLCRMNGGVRPGRLSIVMPDPARPTSITLSGGPFPDAVALQRCPAHP